MKNNCKVLDFITQNFNTKKSFKYLAKSEDVNKKNVKENTVGVEIKISFICITIYYHHRVLITIHTRYNVRSALIYWSQLSNRKYLMSRKMVIIMPPKFIIQYHSFHYKFWRYFEAGEFRGKKAIKLEFLRNTVLTM